MTEMRGDPADIAAQKYQKDIVPYYMAPMAGILLEYAEPQPGERVVDVACGTGVLARRMAPRVGAAGSVAAVDINPAMLKIGRSIPAPEGAAIDWREGSALHLPLSDAGFDLAVCQHGLPFMPDPLLALQEIRRVLKPGGRAVVCVWGSIEQNPFWKLIWGGFSRRLNESVESITKAFTLGDPMALRGLFEKAGFSEIQVVSRGLTVQQPWNDRYIEDALAGAQAALPAVGSMSAAQLSALVAAIEAEAGPELRRFAQDGITHIPMMANIARARR